MEIGCVGARAQAYEPFQHRGPASCTSYAPAAPPRRARTAPTPRAIRRHAPQSRPRRRCCYAAPRQTHARSVGRELHGSTAVCHAAAASCTTASPGCDSRAWWRACPGGSCAGGLRLSKPAPHVTQVRRSTQARSRCISVAWPACAPLEPTQVRLRGGAGPRLCLRRAPASQPRCGCAGCPPHGAAAARADRRLHPTHTTGAGMDVEVKALGTQGSPPSVRWRNSGAQRQQAHEHDTPSRGVGGCAGGVLRLSGKTPVQTPTEGRCKQARTHVRPHRVPFGLILRVQRTLACGTPRPSTRAHQPFFKVFARQTLPAVAGRAMRARRRRCTAQRIKSPMACWHGPWCTVCAIEANGVARAGSAARWERTTSANQC